jgi:hypothetical protein
MAERLELTQTRIANGRWEGVLTGAAGGVPPALEALHLGQRIDGLSVTPMPGQPGSHAVCLALPPPVLSEGVQTVLLQAGDRVLHRLTLVVGVPLEDDIRAEISLLRAELDLLKRAFRRHCSETAG